MVPKHHSGLMLGWTNSVLTFLDPTSFASHFMLLYLVETHYGLGARLKQPHTGALHGALIAKKLNIRITHFLFNENVIHRIA